MEEGLLRFALSWAVCCAVRAQQWVFIGRPWNRSRCCSCPRAARPGNEWRVREFQSTRAYRAVFGTWLAAGANEALLVAFNELETLTGMNLGELPPLPPSPPRPCMQPHCYVGAHTLGGTTRTIRPEVQQLEWRRALCAASDPLRRPGPLARGGEQQDLACNQCDLRRPAQLEAMARELGARQRQRPLTRGAASREPPEKAGPWLAGTAAALQSGPKLQYPKPPACGGGTRSGAGRRGDALQAPSRVTS